MSGVALLLVGDELLEGRRADGNGVWMAARCADLGIPVTQIRMAPDDLTSLPAALRAMAEEASFIVLSGGLGPTQDDVTREALALAAGVPLVEDAEAWGHIQDVLAKRGRTPASGERRQALVPEGATSLSNEVGVAPGIRCSLGDGVTTFALPGVPHELRHLFELHVLPLLTEACGGTPPKTRVVWITGLAESDVADRTAADTRDVTVASYPHRGEIELRLTAEGDDAALRVEHAERAVRERLGACVYDPGPGERLEHVLVRALAQAGKRLAVAESFTGGLLARMLTRVPGASAVFPVGWVTYASEEKTARLGVPAELIAEHGVVSEAVARAMAEGALARAGSDYALATTGSAGPEPLVEPGREPVPVGRVCLALARRDGEPEACTLNLPHPRELVQRFGALKALDLLRLALRAH